MTKIIEEVLKIETTTQTLYVPMKNIQYFIVKEMSDEEQASI